MVRVTRPISCFTLRSRSGVPMTPRKYLETTTLVATCDQVVGIDVVLLEDRLSLLVRDRCRAGVPLHLVEGRQARAGKVPLPSEAVAGALRSSGGLRRRRVGTVGCSLLGRSGQRGPTLSCAGRGGERTTSHAVG